MANANNSGLNGYHLFCKETAQVDESLKEMSFKERNPFLADAWRDLEEDEKEDYNFRAKTEKILTTKELCKRTLKRIERECKNLTDLGLKCLFLCDDDASGTGTMPVYGHPRALRFAETNHLGGKYYAFVNGEGTGAQPSLQKDGDEKASLRLQVQKLFNSKYSEACGKAVKVPYQKVSAGEVRLEVSNLPDGMSFKHPSSYGVDNLKKIISIGNDILFKLEGCHNPAETNNALTRNSTTTVLEAQTASNGSTAVLSGVSPEIDVETESTRTRSSTTTVLEAQTASNGSTAVPSGVSPEIDVETERPRTRREKRKKVPTASSKTGRKEPQRKRQKTGKQKSSKQGENAAEERGEEQQEQCAAYLCQKPLVEKKQSPAWIQCDVCDEWYHFECVGVKVTPKGKYACGCHMKTRPKISTYPSDMALLSLEFSGLKTYIKDIVCANRASRRHELFINHKEADILHLSCNIVAFFSSGMINRFTLELFSILPKFWAEFNQTNSRHCSYVMSVLVPEAIIYVMMKKEGCSRQRVEYFLGTTEGVRDEPENGETSDE